MTHKGTLEAIKSNAVISFNMIRGFSVELSQCEHEWEFSRMYLYSSVTSKVCIFKSVHTLSIILWPVLSYPSGHVCVYIYMCLCTHIYGPIYINVGLLPLYIARLLHRIPFAIWHRHVLLASDRCCAALVPEVTNDLLDCLFFSHKALFVWRWPPMQPRALWWSRGLLLLVFWDHIYLQWILCVRARLCVCVGKKERGVEWANVSVCALACVRTWMWTAMLRKMPTNHPWSAYN